MGQDHFFFVFSMHTKMYIGICLASRNLYVIIDLVSLILAQNEIFLNGAQKEIWKVQWALHIDKPHPTKRWKVKTTHPLPWKMPKKCKCRVRPAWLDPLANAQWRYVRKSQMHIPLNSPPSSWLPKARPPNLHPIGSQNSPPPVRNRHPSINTNITIHGTILSP